MIPDEALPHVVTVTTPTTATDGYGNTVLDYTSGATREVRGFLQPLPGSEFTDGRQAIETRARLFTNATIAPLERVAHAGRAYDIDGSPEAWGTLPGGEPGHSELILRRVDG